MTKSRRIVLSGATVAAVALIWVWCVPAAAALAAGEQEAFGGRQAASLDGWGPASAATVPGGPVAVQGPPEWAHVPGLSFEVPAAATVVGRVVMGGPIKRAEVTISEYDLASGTPGRSLGMAIVGGNDAEAAQGGFVISYFSKSPVRYLVLQARGIIYAGPAGAGVRRVDLMSSIVSGLPSDPRAVLMISPVTDVIYHRFRYLGAWASAQGIADRTSKRFVDSVLGRAVWETQRVTAGTGWALVQNPLLGPSVGDIPQAQRYFAAWDEAIRFQELSASAYFEALSKDYEDGKLDGRDGKGRSVEVTLNSSQREPVGPTFFTKGFVEAYARYQACAEIYEAATADAVNADWKIDGRRRPRVGGGRSSSNAVADSSPSALAASAKQAQCAATAASGGGPAS